MVAEPLQADGFAVFAHRPEVAAWAKAAYAAGLRVLSHGGDTRHGQTWFVGVDALPNAPDGSVDGVPLAGPFMACLDAPEVWHAAQLSVVFPGYPRQDADETDAAHRYRHNRDAAHVDGLLPEGPARRRHLREPHGFILGLPLNACAASPLVVWPGSHKIMQAAFAAAFAGTPSGQWGDVDLTDVYQAARRVAFNSCERVEVAMLPGQAVLLNRHLLHGVAPWEAEQAGDMRMVAYFRPQIDAKDWL